MYRRKGRPGEHSVVFRHRELALPPCNIRFIHTWRFCTTEVGLEIQRKTLGQGFYPMLNSQLGSTHNLAGSKIWHTHTHAHYALESTSVTKDRNLTVHSEFYSTFWEISQLHLETTQLEFFLHKFLYKSGSCFIFQNTPPFFLFFSMFSFDTH